MLNKYLETFSRRALCITCAGLLAACFAASALAQKEVMHERHEGFESMGSAMKAINGELKAGTPNIAKIDKKAEVLAEMAVKIPQWFPAGSGPESGVKTDALPYIWKNTEKFSKSSDDFIAASKLLVVATKGTDVAAIRKQFMAVKETCGACHDSFRAD
jgi:cytochrome c556